MGGLFSRGRAGAATEDTNKQYSWDKRERRNADDFQFQGLEGKTVGKQSGDIGLNAQFIIDKCKNCNVYLMDVSSTVTIDECENCNIFVGPVQTSIFIRNSTNCKMVVACQQFRTRDCDNLDIAIYCQTLPIIESSTNMTFRCYRGGYFALSGQLSSAKLNPYVSYWAKIHDFTPNRDDPNYTCTAEEPAWLSHFWEHSKAAVANVDVSIEAAATCIPVTQGPGSSATETSCMIIVFHDALKAARKLARAFFKLEQSSVKLVQTRAGRLTGSDLRRLYAKAEQEAVTQADQGSVVTFHFDGEGCEETAASVAQASGITAFATIPAGNPQVITSIHSHLDTAMKI